MPGALLLRRRQRGLGSEEGGVGDSGGGGAADGVDALEAEAEEAEAVRRRRRQDEQEDRERRLRGSAFADEVVLFRDVQSRLVRGEARCVGQGRNAHVYRESTKEPSE